MATYVIGDVQGCYNELQRLLDTVDYNEHQDRLWFCGDLVNRGPDSLGVLRFVYAQPHAMTVLGNHDFHLLALAIRDFPEYKHSLHDILNAPDRDEMIAWLSQQPLLHVDTEQNLAISHAGIPPCWDLTTAQACAREAEAVVKADCTTLIEHMYGNEPRRWSEDLQDWERIRYIINAFTRMRYCTEDGGLDLDHAGPPDAPDTPSHLIPWFRHPKRLCTDTTLAFGHWASLQANVNEAHLQALDGGAVWGNTLVAWRVEDKQRFSVHASN